MTKILKKSLACLLAFVLCFTAIASCLAVSAEAPALSCNFALYAQRPSGNDKAVGGVCEGELLRAQLDVTGLTAGTTMGIAITMPEGVVREDITVTGWSRNTACALNIVSDYLDEETNTFTMVVNVVAGGSYSFYVRFNITENVPKNSVMKMNCTVEAANTSAVGDENIYTYNSKDAGHERPMEVKAHDEVVDAAVAATCEGTGLTEGSHCSRCEKTLVAQEEVAALGHAWDEGVVDPDATCTDEGVITYTCKNDPSHTYTEAISAKGHTPADALVNNGDNHSVVCDVCGAVLETADHEYVDGTCACGATKPAEGPVLDENLQFRDFDINVTHAVNIRYRIYANTTKGINGYKTLGYDKVEVVAYGTEYSFDASNLYNTVDVPETALYKEDTSVGHNFFYQGISMISLGHKISVYIKAYDAQGNYVAYSPVSQASPEDLIKATIEKATTDNAKRTNVELLNMAAAAQEKFAADKAGTDLANDVAAGKLVNKNVDQTLAITTMPELVAVDDTPVWEADIDTTFQTSHKISIGARLQQSPGIRLNIGGRTTLDQSKLRVEFTYFDPDKTVNTTVTKVVEGVDAVQNGARWAFDVPTLEFHNSDQTITGKVYYDVDDDGELELLGTIQYSIDASIKETIETSSNEKVIKLNEAIAKFGLAFRVNKGITTL